MLTKQEEKVLRQTKQLIADMRKVNAAHVIGATDDKLTREVVFQIYNLTLGEDSRKEIEKHRYIL